MYLRTIIIVLFKRGSFQFHFSWQSFKSKPMERVELYERQLELLSSLSEIVKIWCACVDILYYIWMCTYNLMSFHLLLSACTCRWNMKETWSPNYCVIFVAIGVDALLMIAMDCLRACFKSAEIWNEEEFLKRKLSKLFAELIIKSNGFIFMLSSASVYALNICPRGVVMQWPRKLFET